MIIIFSQTKPAMAVSLSTNSRWIVNEGGQRVKLACVNWVSHLAPVVAEWIQSPRGSCPWDSIVLARLTWPVLSLATNLSPETDGNGFFGDKYFNPDVWIEGLTQMATMFKGVANFIGMSLRNELRGPRQNVNDWPELRHKSGIPPESATEPHVHRKASI
ncbi:hypothetical protein FH972_008802 [Carpinus fangiana]|uniref:Uncharacterized protein n=1 Tax=Carpinus fangiana TaxID=176857 RepID=A0A5N6R1F0_9ROSI|nr:hypothetical protein FH972_008802 [Carpinus fangiana]